MRIYIFFYYSDEKQISILYQKTTISQENSSLTNPPNKKQFRYILPRPPLQDINQLQ